MFYCYELQLIQRFLGQIFSGQDVLRGVFRQRFDRRRSHQTAFVRPVKSKFANEKIQRLNLQSVVV